MKRENNPTKANEKGEEEETEGDDDDDDESHRAFQQHKSLLWAVEAARTEEEDDEVRRSSADMGLEPGPREGQHIRRVVHVAAAVSAAAARATPTRRGTAHHGRSCTVQATLSCAQKPILKRGEDEDEVVGAEEDEDSSLSLSLRSTKHLKVLHRKKSVTKWLVNSLDGSPAAQLGRAQISLSLSLPGCWWDPQCPSRALATGGTHWWWVGQHEEKRRGAPLTGFP